MLARLAIFALLPLFAAAAFVVAYFLFYQGGYDPPPPVDVPFEQIGTTSIQPRVSDELPPGQLRQGLLVVDAQHGNSFKQSELVSFASRVTDRGFDVEYLGDFTPLAAPGQAQLALLQLAEKLRRADSFVVILPQVAYTETEAALVQRFVNRGGRLLLIFRSLPSAEHRCPGQEIRGGFPRRLSLQHC